jgi:cupin fold WbuC family metalloprotein
MTKIISNEDLTRLAGQAAQSDRLRTHLNVHDSLEAGVQRLFIATEPGTYMRPHRHPQPHKWEFLMLVAGQIDLLLFDDDGTLTQRENLSATAVRAVEIPPNTWHACSCQQSGTVVIEIKEGAYIPTPAEDFAPWTPAENTEQGEQYRQWMQHAKPGSKYPD